MHHFEQLIRENPPSAGQISVVAPAHLRKLPTAGNSVEQYKYRVNGSATRLPPWGLAYLNPPNPLFKGAHQGLRAFHRLMAFPARHLMMPCSALERGTHEAGGPGPHGGFLLPDTIASVRHD